MREAFEVGGSCQETLPEVIAHRHPCRSDDERLHPSVDGIGAPFDEAALFEPVDDPSDRGRIAHQLRSKVAHRERTSGDQATECVCLLRAEPDLGDRADQVLLHQPEHAEEQIGDLSLEGAVRVVTGPVRSTGRRRHTRGRHGVGDGRCVGVGHRAQDYFNYQPFDNYNYRR